MHEVTHGIEYSNSFLATWTRIVPIIIDRYLCIFMYLQNTVGGGVWKLLRVGPNFDGYYVH